MESGGGRRHYGSGDSLEGSRGPRLLAGWGRESPVHTCRCPPGDLCPGCALPDRPFSSLVPRLHSTCWEQCVRVCQPFEQCSDQGSPRWPLSTGAQKAGFQPRGPRGAPTKLSLSVGLACATASEKLAHEHLHLHTRVCALTPGPGHVAGACRLSPTGRKQPCTCHWLVRIPSQGRRYTWHSGTSHKRPLCQGSWTDNGRPFLPAPREHRGHPQWVRAGLF